MGDDKDTFEGERAVPPRGNDDSSISSFEKRLPASRAKEITGNTDVHGRKERKRKKKKEKKPPHPVRTLSRSYLFFPPSSDKKWKTKRYINLYIRYALIKTFRRNVPFVSFRQNRQRKSGTEEIDEGTFS